jgi:hypothetical protein
MSLDHNFNCISNFYRTHVLFIVSLRHTGYHNNLNHSNCDRWRVGHFSTRFSDSLVLFYVIRYLKKGNYGDILLDGLNVLVIASFKGNIWTGDGFAKTIMAIFFDDKSDEKQRKALNMIFSGKAGGFMAQFAKLGEIRGIEYALLSLRLQMTCLIGVQKYRVKS